MAQRVVTLFTDDITGEAGEDISTHTISLDGVGCEIDLGNDNYQKLLDELGPYLNAGRRTGFPKPGRAKRAKSTDQGPDALKVREWARSQGIVVSLRGRVSKDVVEKYTAAH
jgi:hypothetical protein